MAPQCTRLRRSKEGRAPLHTPLAERLLGLSILARRPHWPHLKRPETSLARLLDVGRANEAVPCWGVDTEVGSCLVRRLRRNLRAPLAQSDWLRVARVGLSKRAEAGSRCPLARRRFTQIGGRRAARGGRGASRAGWKLLWVSVRGRGALRVGGCRGEKERAGPQLLVAAPGFSTPSYFRYKVLRGARTCHYGA